MPPQTRARAKAKAKAKAKVQAEADENKPSFDVDESVAAAVLEKVTSTRDRVALACVSQVWKNAVTSEGAWGTCDLVLDGELGKRLTDERFERLLCYCGDIKHLEVRDAPLSFVGNFLSGEGIAAKFASLESFKLTNCPGVNVSDVAEFMSLIGMEARPEEKRLRCLRVAECCSESYQDVVDSINTLQECLAIDQKEVFHKPVESDGFVLEGIYEQVEFLNLAKHRASFDLWHCDGYEEGSLRCCGFTATPYMKICENCAEVFCPDCVADSEGTSCHTCGFFVCGECDADNHDDQLVFCDGSDCDKVFCRECVCKIHVCFGSDAVEGCFCGFCEDCYDKSPDLVFRYCEGCDGLWCFDCWDGNLICDDGDCDAVMCRACADAAEHEFFCCHDGCEKTWCSECKPDAEFACCMFCAGMWCEECDPGLRSVEDTLVDGVPAPYIGDECCPTCEVTEFIFS